MFVWADLQTLEGLETHSPGAISINLHVLNCFALITSDSCRPISNVSYVDCM